MKKYIIIAALILSIVALILSIIALGISYSNNKVCKSEDRIIYESENLGLSIGFPSEWKDKYVIKESEGSIAVFSKKVYEKYPRGGLLFTIERMIGIHSFT